MALPVLKKMERFAGLERKQILAELGGVTEPSEPKGPDVEEAKAKESPKPREAAHQPVYKDPQFFHYLEGLGNNWTLRGTFPASSMAYEESGDLFFGGQLFEDKGNELYQSRGAAPALLVPAG